MKLLLLALGLLSLGAQARDLLKERCLERYAKLQDVRWPVPAPKALGTLVLPTRNLVATQRRFSLRKVEKAMEAPSLAAVKVVVWNEQAYVLDGHHRLLVNVLSGQSETAVNVVYNFTGLTETAFLEQMRELTYIEDEAHGPDRLSPCEMRDDPDLYLVRLITRNVTLDDELELTKSKGAKQPLIIKINGGPTFPELRLAADLRAAGITYDPKWEKRVPAKVARRIRKVLAKSTWARAQSHLFIVPKRMAHDDPRLLTLMRERWRGSEKCGETLHRMPAHSGESQ